MADYYCETSTLIEIPAEKKEQVEPIVKRVKKQLDEEDGWVGFYALLLDEGLWIQGNENANVDHVETLVRTLVEELDLPGIHVCSFSHTCSRPIIDSFGGSAFAIRKGHDTVYVDAADEVRNLKDIL